MLDVTHVPQSRMEFWPQGPQTIGFLACHRREAGITHAHAILDADVMYTYMHVEACAQSNKNKPRFTCLFQLNFGSWAEKPPVFFHHIEKLVEPIPHITGVLVSDP